MRRGWILALAAAMTAGTAGATEPLTITPGEVVLIKLDGAGGWTVTERSKPAVIEVSAAEKAFEDALRKEAMPPTVSNVVEKAASRPPPPDAIRLTFKNLSNRPGLILIVESGYPKRLSYTAMTRKGGLPQPTAVCQVLSRVESLEYWPESLLGLDLSGFRLVDVPPSATVECK